MKFFLASIPLLLGLAISQPSTPSAQAGSGSAEAHPYAADFEKYGIGDEYQGVGGESDLTMDERRGVNNLIDNAKDYLLSRISKTGEIEEWNFDRPFAARKTKEEYPAHYRTDFSVYLMNALVVTQRFEFSKEEEKKIEACIEYAADKLSEHRFGSTGHKYDIESMSLRFGRWLELYEMLRGLEQSTFVKKLVKIMKKQAERAEEQILKAWSPDIRPLFCSRLTNSFPEFAGEIHASQGPILAFSENPESLTKERAEIVSQVLRVLVDSVQLAPDTYFRRDERVVQSEEQDAHEDPAQTKTREDGAEDGGKVLLDPPAGWSSGLFAAAYTKSRATRQARASQLKKPWSARTNWVDTLTSSRMILASLRLLKSKQAEAFSTKERSKLIERAEALIWNMIAYVRGSLCGQTPSNGGEFATGTQIEFAFGNTRDCTECAHAASTSRAYHLALFSRYLGRRAYNGFRWYEVLARSALAQKGDGEVLEGMTNLGNREASEVERLRSKFAMNLGALLILRKQPVSEDTEKDPTKPVSGEAKPAEGEGDDKAPKAPAKTPEKTSDGKANKQD